MSKRTRKSIFLVLLFFIVGPAWVETFSGIQATMAGRLSVLQMENSNVAWLAYKKSMELIRFFGWFPVVVLGIILGAYLYKMWKKDEEEPIE